MSQAVIKRAIIRPIWLILLAIFFLFGTIISLIACISLLLPGSMLEPIWQVNPEGYAAFQQMGSWAFALLIVIAGLCAATLVGIWQRTDWGYWLAIAIFSLNLLGDIVNVVLLGAYKAAVGIPIVLLILGLLLRKGTRTYFMAQ